MAAQKRVFFGSHFEFSKAAQDEVRARFSACIEGKNQVPFTSYDENTHTFSFVCDRDDPVPIKIFLGMFKEYLEYEQQRLHLRDQELVDESPKIIPMAGTTIPDTHGLDDLASLNERLIEDFEDNYSDSDDERATTLKPDGLASITKHWVPKSGDISILKRSVAQEIAQLTGSTLDPEPARNRVKIFGGSFDEALYKLNNLEKLMELLASQLLTRSPKASNNILILGANDEDASIEFVRLQSDAFPYHRILVDESSRETLDRKAIGELRRRQVFNGPMEQPPNLREIVHTTENQATRLWSAFRYPTIGTEIRPKLLSERDLVKVIEEPPNKYLSVNENINIARWTEDVTEPIDPGVAADPPAEEEGPRRRVRKVADPDSDSEDESSNQGAHAIAPTALTRIVDKLTTGGSESGESTVSQPQTKQTSRRRVLAVPSDSDKDSCHEESKRELLRTGPTATSPLLSVTETYPAELGPNEEISRRTEQNLCTIATPFATKPAWETPEQLFDFDVETIRDFETMDNKIQDNTTAAMIPAPSATLALAEPQYPPARPLSPFSGLDLSVPVSPPRFPSTTEFDPTRYGQNTRGTLRGRGRGRGSGAGNLNGRGVQAKQNQPSSETQANRNPVDHVSSINTRGREQPAYRSMASRGPSMSLPHRNLARSRGHGSMIPHQPRSDALIEPLSPPRTSAQHPPPGLEIRMPAPILAQPISLIDIPVEPVGPPLFQLASDQNKAPSSTNISNTKSSSISSNSGKYYVNTHNPGLNIMGIETQRLEQLLRMQDQERQRRQEKPEAITRQFYKTMGQKAPKPSSKGMMAPQAETKQQKATRIAKVKEAIGATPQKPKIPLPTLKEQATGSKSAPTLRHEKLKNKQAQDLVTSLGPLFDAVRAFPGSLNFEMQFGQVLIPIGDLSLNVTYGSREWSKIFQPAHGILPAAATFTKMLTMNGADVDRLLETKDPQQKGPARLWDKTSPGQNTVSYEFRCQTKENEEFWLIVDKSGTHAIQKEIKKVGLVNLHYPGQIWDASAVLQGNFNWTNPPEEIVEASAQFSDSLYIPPHRPTIEITYRLPETNQITVRDLVMRRVSLHQCLSKKYPEFQLKVTEVKTLYHRFHQKDKNLGQAFEKNFNTMAADGRLHYEISILHTGINTAFIPNRTLVLGELTDEKTTGTKILHHNKIKDMLELTSYTVSKIDWMGSQNIGTLPRLDAAARARGQTMALAASQRGSVLLPASRMTGLDDDEQRIPGVRAGTKAEILNDGGQLYQRGYGGARVPMILRPDGRLQGIAEEDLVPEDSASVAGGNAKKVRVMYSQGYGPDRSEPGFW